MLQQNLDGLLVAVERRRMERRVAFGLIDGRSRIPLDVRGRAGAKERLDDVPGRRELIAEEIIFPRESTEPVVADPRGPVDVCRPSPTPPAARSARRDRSGAAPFPVRRRAPLIERRQSGLVLRLHIGAEVEQRIQRARLLLDHSKMQRAAVMIGAVHRPVEQLGRSRHQVGDDPGLPHGDGGEDVVPRPVREQIVDDLLSPFPETGRPPDDLQLVTVAVADEIGSVFDEQADDWEVLPLGREMQRDGVVSFVPDVGIGAALEQEPYDRLVPHAEMEGGAQAGVPGELSSLVDDVPVFVEQGAIAAASPLSAA